MPTDDATGFAVQLTHIAIGTGLYSLGGTGDAADQAARAMVALKSEIARYPISSGSNVSPTSIQIGTTITDTAPNGKSPNGKAIGEIGFFAGITLGAVWSRGDSALFVKSASFDIPFAYTLDTSACPEDSVTVTVATDPQGMAALINQHEAKADPHPQYATDTDVAALAVVVGTKEPAIGYKTVQQGGGIGQGANKIYMGAAPDGSGNVKVTVDGVDKGGIAFLGSPAFTGIPTVPTAAVGTATAQAASTQFVASTVSNTLVGTVTFEPRTTARTGYLKANGALLNRADYPALWAYAQTSGALVSESDWTAGSWGCFSSGDGAATFRIPELRGEFIRCYDDSRGIDTSRAIGTYQASQNIAHKHVATSDTVAAHTHTATTDVQGYHGHGVADGGHAHGVGDPGHSHGQPNYGSAQAGGDNGGVGVAVSTGSGSSRTQANVYGSGTGIWIGASNANIGIYGDGNHAHNIAVAAGGGHTHVLTVNNDGGTEARPRNVALTAMIRAF
ncbi:phage tail protein [Paraburkholderia sp. C35]|uniref:phage tail protein n=1 Tax=Paraburkholderia sp. C35 TaxID=2126993 RepID=UPI000D6931B1|nr:phage tail protein [Paraburkholderia sp. C35]